MGVITSEEQSSTLQLAKYKNSFAFLVIQFTGADVPLLSFEHTFNPLSEAWCVTIPTTDDLIFEEQEQFVIQIQSTDRAVNLSDPNTTITILDDES